VGPNLTVSRVIGSAAVKIAGSPQLPVLSLHCVKIAGERPVQLWKKILENWSRDDVDGVFFLS